MDDELAAARERLRIEREISHLKQDHIRIKIGGHDRWMPILDDGVARDDKPLARASCTDADANVSRRELLAAIQDDVMLDAVALANHLSLGRLDKERLRKLLERWRKRHPPGDGWSELADVPPGRPRYVYRVGAIRHILRAAVESAERP